MKHTITFETDSKNIPNFGAAKDIAASIHEALCQAIHEGSEDALDWLAEHVINVE